MVGAASEARPLVDGMERTPRFPRLVSVDYTYLVPPSGKIGGLGELRSSGSLIEAGSFLSALNLWRLSGRSDASSEV
jgi:hypothetical protein